MAYLTERERLTVASMLEPMIRPITWHVSVIPDDPRSDRCVELARELQSLNPESIAVRVDIEAPTESTVDDRVQRFPRWKLLDEKGKEAGFCFLGMPSGYQFASVLNAMIDVSRSRILLEPRTYLWCQRVERSVSLLVVVTPTCPHSPRMVALSQRMALANPRRLAAVIVDASSFPDWADSLGVREVPWLQAAFARDPRPALNVLGTVSERQLLEQLSVWYEARNISEV